MVNVAVPASKGVPVIAPVDVFRVAHVGNAPEVTLQVIGESPVAITVWEYASPTPPGSRTSVVIIAGAGAGLVVSE
jgi:hypothetical protein